MSYPACQNCGHRMYDGKCTNCDEAYFIEQQEYYTDVPEEYAPSENNVPRFEEIVPLRSGDDK